MTVAENEQQILDDYLFIENPQERLGAIVDAARHLPHFAEADRTPANHVPGCTSKVWLTASQDGDRWRFDSDCDSQPPKRPQSRARAYRRARYRSCSRLGAIDYKQRATV